MKKTERKNRKKKQNSPKVPFLFLHFKCIYSPSGCRKKKAVLKRIVPNQITQEKELKN